MFYRKTRKQLDERVASAKTEVEVSQEALAAAQREARERKGYVIYYVEGDDEYPYKVAHDGFFVLSARNISDAHARIRDIEKLLNQKQWFEGTVVYSEPCDAH